MNKLILTALACAFAVAGLPSAVPSLAAQGFGPEDQLVDERLRVLFARAESLFRSLDSEQAYVPLSNLILSLEPAAAAGTISDEGRLLLMRGLAYRAEINLQRGEQRSADADLRSLIALDPAVSVEGYRLSDAVRDRFSRLRAELIGHLEFLVSPSSAQIRVDGEIVVPGPQGYAVIEGTHSVEVTLPGFTTAREDVRVRAGRRERVELSLSRLSAVLRLMTRPRGAVVVVDGNVMGETSGIAAAGFAPSGSAAGYRPEEFSEELVIEGLLPGEHEIEVMLEGYRSYRAIVPIDDLGDFHIGAIVLERSIGMVLLRDMPNDASVWVDGAAVRPEPPLGGGSGDQPASNAHRLPLPPGRHRITVSRGAAGVFEAEVSLAENRNQLITVRLRPGLTFLGVLGGDELSGEALETAVSDAFSAVSAWTYLDRVDVGSRVLRRAGLTAERLRRLAKTGASPDRRVDWEGVQNVTGEELPGSVYLVGVLTADELASEADLFFWPVAPGPARPERLTIALADRAEIEALTMTLAQPIPFQRRWFGAELIDSDAARAPVVASVVTGSPAAAAGLQVGEELISVGGNRVGNAANAQAWLDTFPPGSDVVLSIGGPGGERTVDLRMSSTPEVIPPTEPDQLYAAVWAWATAGVGRLDARVPTWVFQLNQASALLHARAWNDAAELLASIDAPDGPGLSSAMVDYWLGVALSHMGERWLDRAHQAFERAAATPGARYLHNDGPPVGPRARARLATLAER